MKTIEEHLKEIKIEGEFDGLDQNFWVMDNVEVAPIQAALLRNGWTILDQKFHAEVHMEEGKYGELVANTTEKYGHYLYGVWELEHGYRMVVSPEGIDGDQVSMAVSLSRVNDGEHESLRAHMRTFGWPSADRLERADEDLKKKKKGE